MKANYVIKYEGKDITKDLTQILCKLEFVDRLEGKAGDLCIELADHEMKFAGPWYPETDDKIEVWIEDMYCGLFWVDECNPRGGRQGNFSTIRAMSVRARGVLEGEKRKGYKGVPLNDFAKSVATSLGLTVKGNISGTIRDNCLDKNDLQFLSEQATKLGYILKIDSGSLVFAKYEELKQQKTLLINRKDVDNWDIKDKAIGKYIKCICNWFDPIKKEYYHGTHSISGIGGEAVIWEEVESNSEAQNRAKDWLIDKNKQKATIEIDMKGDKRLLAGVHTNISGFGKKDGSYIISEATHTIDRISKYKTSIKLQA